MKKKTMSPERDAFVGQVRPNLNTSDRVSLVSGYVGDSSEKGFVRVYDNETLNNYIDIDTSCILHSEKRSLEQYPLGGSYIWVKNNGEFKYGTPGAEPSKKSTFLEGEIMNKYNASASAQAQSFEDLNALKFTTTRPSLVDGCPSQNALCPATRIPILCGDIATRICPITQGTNCQTYLACPIKTLACPINSLRCPTINNGCRPSLVDGCRSVQVYCPLETWPGCDIRTLNCPSLVCDPFDQYRNVMKHGYYGAFQP